MTKMDKSDLLGARYIALRKTMDIMQAVQALIKEGVDFDEACVTSQCYEKMTKRERYEARRRADHEED